MVMVNQLRDEYQLFFRSIDNLLFLFLNVKFGLDVLLKKLKVLKKY